MRWAACLIALLAACQSGNLEIEPPAASPADPIDPFEGSARGYPVVRRLDGTKLADGEFFQWLENDRLHIRIDYDFGSSHRVEEIAVLRQKPELAQEEWSWTEYRDGDIRQRYQVDFRSGLATAQKRRGGKLESWSKKFEIKRDTFAGIGFSLAIRNARERLLGGEKIELRGVGFMPQPKLGVVSISHAGEELLPMGGRRLRGDLFVIHPKIPWYADLFVEVPDSRLWLSNPPPAGFLRWEGPWGDADDPAVRVDLLPGDPSGPAERAPGR